MFLRNIQTITVSKGLSSINTTVHIGLMPACFLYSPATCLWISLDIQTRAFINFTGAFNNHTYRVYSKLFTSLHHYVTQWRFRRMCIELLKIQFWRIWFISDRKFKNKSCKQHNFFSSLKYCKIFLKLTVDLLTVCTVVDVIMFSDALLAIKTHQIYHIHNSIFHIYLLIKRLASVILLHKKALDCARLIRIWWTDIREVHRWRF